MTAPASTTFRIGGDLEVRRLGFGAMHLRPADAEARAACVTVARRAVELGVTLIDTAHMYGWGANEDLLAEALHPYPDKLVIATKVGIRHTTAGEGRRHAGEPADLRAQVDEAPRRLRLDRIELLQLHRLDPGVPLPDQLGALRDLRDEGKVGKIGLSEVTVTELAEARSVVDIASVQNRYNLLDREHEPVLEACEAAGIAFLPWRPVAAGTSGARSEIAAVAKELDATPTQVVLAWLLAHSPVILPIPGTTSIAHLGIDMARLHQSGQNLTYTASTVAVMTETTHDTLTDERADLLEALAKQRHFLRFTARDLTDEQAGQRTTVSELCLGGLIKHVTSVERHWADFIRRGPSAMPDFTAMTEEDLARRADEFRMLPGETLEGVLAEYNEVTRRTDELITALPDLNASHPLPKAPWNEPGARWSARRVLLHLIAETAQHAGHADIIRESLDGAKTMG